MEVVRNEERRFYAYCSDSRKQGIQLVTLFPIISANPSIAVNADPDNYILFGMNSHNRVEVHAGFSIDELQNKSRLIDLLEGGMNSFIHRKQRYENTV